MAISQGMVWEMTTSGNPYNSAGFRFGAVSGVDYTQQPNCKFNFSDLFVDSKNNTWVGSIANPFTTDLNGNTIRIFQTNNGFASGVYEIMTIVQSGIAVLDRSPGASGISGGSGTLGGSHSDFPTMMSSVAAGNYVNIKQGIYNIGTSSTYPQASTPFANSNLPTRIIGYSATRGDGAVLGSPIFNISGGIPNATTVFNFSNNGWHLENLEFNCNNVNSSATAVVGIGGQYTYLRKLKIYNFAGSSVAGLSYSSSNAVANSCVSSCEFFSGAIGITTVATCVCVESNFFHNLTNCGMNTSNTFAGFSVVNNVFDTLGNGIFLGGGVVPSLIHGNTFFKSGSAISCGSLGLMNFSSIKYNIFSQGTYGINASFNGTYSTNTNDGNVYHSNTSGRRNGVDDGDLTLVWPVNALGRYIRRLDVDLSDTPFVNGSGDNFNLNNVVLAGGLCRGSGIISLSNNYNGYRDFGALSPKRYLLPILNNGGYNS
jgi:hypothetical protein